MDSYTRTSLSPTISLYTLRAPPTNPTETTSSSKTGPAKDRPTPPTLILLLAWMGATRRQTESYIRGYIELYPSTQPTFLVISSEITDFVTLSPSSTTGNARKLRPALDILAAHAPEDTLVHIFSNGGVRVFSNLASAYISAPPTSASFPSGETPRALFPRLAIDSAPGRLTYTETSRAVSSALPPSPLVKYPAYAFLSLILAVYLGLKTVLGWDDPLEVGARSLNDPEIVGVHGRRCYFYSNVDGVVKAEFVEGHAGEARRRGLGTVEMEVFDGSGRKGEERGGHVRHVRVDAGRYWGAVARL
ncbi:hypothetical protein ASPCAL13618 [Aspergillus calidoustus]|uniref:Indole-diterpene biosynthesis protein PaxU n=1 Tax=Aspergillus calidoustus TaxID=454130 RepID=A0A0U5GFI8_ASPCI|nr:hypothetical protein ASPCAL13618 [Aspergillus calidoustus]